MLDTIGEVAALTWQQTAVVSYLKKRPECVSCLHDSLFNSPQFHELNMGVAYVLGEIGNSKSIPILRGARKKLKKSYGDDELVLALAKCGDGEVLPELYQMHNGCLEHKREVDQLLRKLTGRNFGEIKTEQDAQRIFDEWKAVVDHHKQNDPASFLQSKHRFIRCGAIRMIVLERKQDAAELLIPLLEDPDPVIRAQAARSLGALADKRAVEPLREALDDEDSGVRKEAEDALNAIEGGEGAYSVD